MPRWARARSTTWRRSETKFCLGFSNCAPTLLWTRRRDDAMTGRFIQAAGSAYKYPLLIKQLWHTPLAQAPDQVIVYRGIKRFTYRQLRERIGQLASSLARLGIGAGDTVGVLDWDSNRFLEAYFAVPMMGAVLQTVNVRLSPEQIVHTINHAGSSVLLVNDEFVPTLEDIRNKLPKVKRLVLMLDKAVPPVG